jgi:glycosyltransferase involved in cell wall biosynthesis
MPNSNPFFSIILPTYNRANLITPALNSVVGQTFLDWELIVVDDGSTDETEKVVKSYGDARIRYFWKENEEKCVARRFGLQQATGKYVCFLDSDDYYYSDYLAFLNQWILSTQKNLYFTSHEGRDLSGNFTRSTILPPDYNFVSLAKENIVSTNCVCIKKSVIPKDLFPHDLKFKFGQDHYAWLQVAVNHQPMVSPKITAVLTSHPTKISNNLQDDFILYSIGRMKELFDNHPKMVALFPPSANHICAIWYATAAYFSIARRQRQKGFIYLCKAIRCNPAVIFHKRTLSTFYRFLIPKW